MEYYDVVTCHKCGFAYAYNVPKQQKYNNYYSKMSKYESINLIDNNINGYDNYCIEVVDFIKPHLFNENAKILDIGCSTGRLLSMFQKRGYLNLVGIDPSPTCVKIAKENYHIKAIVNNISSLSIKEKFDLIIMSSVLEHLVNIRYALKKISLILKEGGFLFIVTPDIERFKAYITAPFQQFSTEHINYFSRYSLRNLLSYYSFRPIEMIQHETRLNMNTDPDIFSLSIKNRNSEKVFKKDIVSKKGVREYVKKCKIIDMKVRQIINQELSDIEKVIVWGVGTHTQRLIGSGFNLSQIQFFVDSNIRYVGKKLHGIEIKSPEAIINEELPILISTFSFQKEIIYQIREILGLKNKIITIYKE